jgi:sirohydrochlorin ferrochelatase
MKGLLIISHGSSRIQANQEFLELVQTVQKQMGDLCVQAAFLEKAAPNNSGWN